MGLPPARLLHLQPAFREQLATRCHRFGPHLEGDDPVHLHKPIRMPKGLHAEKDAGADRPLATEDFTSSFKDRCDQFVAMSDHIDRHPHHPGWLGTEGFQGSCYVSKALRSLQAVIVRANKAARAVDGNLPRNEGQRPGGGNRDLGVDATDGRRHRFRVEVRQGVVPFAMRYMFNKGFIYADIALGAVCAT